MIKTIKRLWKEVNEDVQFKESQRLLIETFKAKEEWEIHPLTVEQITWLKKSVRFIIGASLVIGFILGAIIF